MAREQVAGRTAGHDVLDLERIAALGWPGVETETIDGWLLRAGGGWTGRANAALPLRDVGDDVDTMLDVVARWYGARDLPPLVQVPLPVRSRLRDQLVARGWIDRWGAVVLTSGIDAVLRRVPRHAGLPDVAFADAPGAAWVGAYHYLGGALPDIAVDVLRAGAAHFLSVVEDDDTVAICRIAIDEGWVGITAVEVAPRHRRRGLATHLLVAALEQGSACGATNVYLQTKDANRAALTLYRRAGFARHHHYRYHGPPPD